MAQSVTVDTELSTIAGAIKLIGFGVSFCLTIINKRIGRPSSGILFIFWTLLAIANSFTFASVIRFGDVNGQVIDYGVFCVYYGAVVANFFLHFWADPAPNKGYVNIDGRQFYYFRFYRLSYHSYHSFVAFVVLN